MNAKDLKVNVTADTSRLQLKLRAIAKHTEALADELEEIDSAVCPECGSANTETVRVFADVTPVEYAFICNECERSIPSKGFIKEPNAITNHITINASSIGDVDMEKVAKELFNIQRSDSRGR